MVVFVHGGGFVTGDGSMNTYGPEYFMDTEAVVLVTLNYR